MYRERTLSTCSHILPFVQILDLIPQHTLLGNSVSLYHHKLSFHFPCIWRSPMQKFRHFLLLLFIIFLHVVASSSKSDAEILFKFKASLEVKKWCIVQLGFSTKPPCNGHKENWEGALCENGTLRGLNWNCIVKMANIFWALTTFPCANREQRFVRQALGIMFY